MISSLSPCHFGFNNPIRYNDPLGLMGNDETVGADGLTNSQWIEASRPGADLSLARNYRMQNRMREREQNYLEDIINYGINGDIDKLESFGLSGYYTLDKDGFSIVKLYIDGLGSFHDSGGSFYVVDDAF